MNELLRMYVYALWEGATLAGNARELPHKKAARQAPATEEEKISFPQEKSPFPVFPFITPYFTPNVSDVANAAKTTRVRCLRFRLKVSS